MKTQFLCFSLMVFTLSACTENTQLQSSTASSTPVSTSQTATTTIIPKTGIWIDVRTKAEFNTGHLEGALNITTEDLAEQIQQVAPDKNTEIHLYCRSGRRAEDARRVLLNMGYTNVTNQGGYQDLLKKGFR